MPEIFRVRLPRLPALLASCSLLLPVLGPAVGTAAQEPPQFRSTVELVQLQVGVAGPDGKFVKGLGPDDFLVRIDGEERPVQVAYEVDLRDDGGAPVAAAGVTSDTRERPRPVAARRHFLLLFDFSFIDRRGVLEAREAALHFVDEQVHEDDLLAVATYNRYGFRLLTPFTAAHDEAREAVSTLGLADARDTITTGMDFEDSIMEAIADSGDLELGQAMSSANFREYVAQVNNYTDDLAELGRTLQAIEGRKHVVLFSRGFDDRALTGLSLDALSAGAEARASSPAAVAGSDPEQMYGPAEVRHSMEELIEQFRAADAVIHAVDPSGLRASHGGHQALTSLATGTGGSLSWNMNDVSVALAQIESSTAAYYMIGYPARPDDPPTVTVDVEVRVPDVRVVSAPAVLAPPPGYEKMTEAQRQLQLAEFLADDRDRRDIAFEAQVVPFVHAPDSGSLALVLEIPGAEVDALANERGDSRVQLEVAGFALDESDHVVGAVRRGITVDVADMRRRGAVYEQTLRMSEYVQVPPGTYRVRVLVRERRVGRLSTRTLAAHLGAPPEHLDLARPLVLASGTAPARGDDGPDFDPLALGGRVLLPEAAPVVSPGSDFRILVVAYNLPRHPVTGEVEAGLVLELEGLDGDVVPVRDFEVMGTHELDGGVSQLLVDGRIPDDLPTGGARLWARLVDRVSGARAEEQTAVFVSTADATDE